MKKLLKPKLFVAVVAIAMIGAIAIPWLSGSLTRTYAASPPLSEGAANSSCLQPPSNANPLSMSDAQLDSYGWPDHATINENSQKWLDLLSHARHHYCDFTSISPVSTLSSPNTASCPQPGSECNSSLWSGNEAQGSRGTYREASVEFNVPSIPTSPTNALVAIWAGVGGDPAIAGQNAAVLVQSGLIIKVIQKNSQYVQYNETFWEVAPNFAATNMPLNSSLSVNDDLFFDAQSNSVANPNENFFYVEDKSNGGYGSYSTYNTQYNILSDSATGECIVEWPGGQDGGASFAQFQEQGQAANTVLLTNCKLGTNSETLYPLGSYSHHYLVLVDNSGNQMDAVGPLTNSGANFTITWKRGT